jgi:ABC-type transport system involved in multi-copper enzyme maturation permease subunit
MKALLWKDFRVTLPIMIAAVFIWIVAHAIAAVSMTFFAAHHNRLDAQSWVEMVFGVSTATLVFSQLLIGALGANAMATERGDRSAEFLFYLPLTRRQMLASKLFVAVVVALAIWLWHLLVLEIVCPALLHFVPSERLPSYAVVVASGLSLFGAAWFASSFMRSTAYSLLASLALFAAIGAVFFNTVQVWDWPSPQTREVWFVGIHLTLGLVGYCAGTWYFTRRVEP